MTTTNESKVRELWRGQIVKGPAIYAMAVSLTFQSSVVGYGNVLDEQLVSFGISPPIRTNQCNFAFLHARIMQLTNLYSYVSWEVKASFPSQALDALNMAFNLEVDGFGRFWPVYLNIPTYDLRSHESVRGDATLVQEHCQPSHYM